jgi:restriction system protein
MSSSLDRIRKFSPEAFRDFIAEIYRGEGYLVEQAARGRAAGTYDLVLLRETSVLVQCKYWLVDQVGVAQVRELGRAMKKVGATGGVVITTGTFTKAARELAIGLAIELVDGPALTRQLARVHNQPGGKPKAA